MNDVLHVSVCVDERQASVWVSRSWVCVFGVASAPCLPTRVQVDKESAFAEVMRNSLSLCPCVLLVTHTGGDSLQEREASFMSRRPPLMRGVCQSGGEEAHKNLVHKGTEI